MNEKFRAELQTAISTQIPGFLEILQNNYEKVPHHLKGIFNALKHEFTVRPNGFSLGDWQSRLSTLILNFDFEIVSEVNKEIPKEDNLEKGQRIIHTQNYFENIQNMTLNQNKNDDE